MKVKLIHITHNAEEMIGRCAAKCYDSKTDSASCIRRCKNCKERGHLATARFAHAIFEISEISRVCSHQAVRSKFLDFLQESQRYVENTENLYVVPPSIAVHPEALQLYKDTQDLTFKAYGKLRELGIHREDARYVLTGATETSLNVVGSMQAWLDFIELRTPKAAQWEIRSVATQIEEILKHECPNLF